MTDLSLKSSLPQGASENGTTEDHEKRLSTTEYRMHQMAWQTLKQIKRGVNKRLIGRWRDDGTPVPPLSMHCLATLTWNAPEATAAAQQGVDLRAVINEELQSRGLSGTRDPRFRIMLTLVLSKMPENNTRLN